MTLTRAWALLLSREWVPIGGDIERLNLLTGEMRVTKIIVIIVLRDHILRHHDYDETDD